MSRLPLVTRKGYRVNGYDMMCDLADYLGEWAVLDELCRYFPDSQLVDAMVSIARDHDYLFDGESED